MAGGSGFIVDSNNLGKNNRELRKIRPSLTPNTRSRSGKNASVAALSDAIRHRFVVKFRSQHMTRFVFSALGIGILLLILILYFSS